MIRSIIFIFLLVSCGIQKMPQEMTGKYSYYKKGFRYNLLLNGDSTFFMSIRGQDVRSECRGKWSYLQSDIIFLKCDDVKDLSELVSNGYMSVRERKLVIISRNKLRLNEIVLKRKK